MLKEYLSHVEERKSEHVPPTPLSREQVESLSELLQNPPSGQEELLMHLITNCVPPGVDPAAEAKADFLQKITSGAISSPLINKIEATELLGTMLGGYNIKPLIDLLENDTLAETAAKALSKTLLIFDAFDDVFKKYSTNKYAKEVIDSWANATWFTEKKQTAGRNNVNRLQS